MFAKNKHGSVILETGILLPVVIVGILTLAYLIKILYFQEIIFHALVNESRKTAVEAYIYELKVAPKGLGGQLLRIGPQNKYIFESRLKNTLNSNGELNLQKLKVDEFRYLFRNQGIKDLISIRLSYDIRLNLPIGYIRTIKTVQQVLLRAWTGSTEYKKPMAFKDMEMEGTSHIVYVFPRSGEKYHKRDCSFISSHPTLEILSDYIKTHYLPCSICDASSKSTGSVVFCFRDYGKAYHSSECSIIDKYVIEIEETEALEKGYQCCSKCRGGQ